MTLTKSDLVMLKAPFLYAEHEFNQNGFVYIEKKPIIVRLNSVDPAWQFEITSTFMRDRQAVCVARMTVKGVSRSDIGMSIVEVSKKDPTRDAGEAEKAAATDALKRCAALFDIGLYLQDAPKEKGEFKAFLQNYTERYAVYAKTNGDSAPITKQGEYVSQGDIVNAVDDAPIITKADEIIQSLPQVVVPPSPKVTQGEFISIKATTRMVNNRPVVTLHSMDGTITASFWSRAESGFTAAVSPAVNEAVASVGTHAIASPILVKWEYDKKEDYRNVIKGGITKKAGAPPDLSQMPD